MNMLLEIKDVYKTYRKGRVKANDGISLSVEKGEIFGLLGPNGAGKTTLVKQIIGLVKPDSGSITIDGVDAVANPGYARQICSFQSQTKAPTVGLTPLQAIQLVGKIRGGKSADVRERTRELIDKLQMKEWEKTIGLNSTGGVQRLVAFCMAVVIPGNIVILDEPTNDIDPLRRRLLWQEVQAVAEKGSTVLLVTHNVLEAERVVDRLAIIDQGKVKGTGTPAELKTDENGSIRLELTVDTHGQSPWHFYSSSFA
jgi:ABC-2 type transport system ATP-binding protein